MQLTGDVISADTAARLGLVNRVMEPEGLDSAVDDLARHIADRPAVAVRTGKRMFYEQIDKELADAYNLAADVMARNMMAEDTVEGIDAFIAKRDPAWKR